MTLHNEYIFPDWTFQVRPYLVVEGECYGVVVVVALPACPGHSVLALSEAPHGAAQSDRLAQGRRQVPADRPGNVSLTLRMRIINKLIVFKN